MAKGDRHVSGAWRIGGGVGRHGAALRLLTYQSVANPNIGTLVGYAQLLEGEGLSGQAIFRQIQPNGRVYAAASPLAMPARSFILPSDNTARSITAAAIANPSRGENVLQVATRRESGGLSMEEPTRRLNPWQHRAEPMETLFSDTVRSIYSVVDVNATGVPVAALGLRFLADNGPFSSFNPIDKEPWSPALRTRPTIAQIVSGSTWNTTLILVNIQPIPANFKIEFRDGTGAPLPLTWDKRTPGTVSNPANAHELAGTIPGGGMAVYQTIGDPTGPVRQGYARLTEGTLVKGQAVFTQTTAAGVRYEAASPLRPGSSWIMVPFDNVGSETGLAVVNTTPIQTSMTVRITNEDGTLIGQSRIGLQANEHKAGTVTALLPDFAAQLRGKRGVIELVSLPSEVHALGLRFEGEFFTSFPVIALQ